MSIDFSPYINLRVYDRDPAQIYLSALELLQVNIPQLSVRPGTIEDALIQAFSYVTSIAITHINTMPNMLMEGLAALIGVSRLSGEFATVTATITALDYSGGELEAGTTFECEYTINGIIYRDYYEIPAAVSIESVTPDLDADPPTPLPSIEANLVARDLGPRQPIADAKKFTILNAQTVSDSAVAGPNFVQGAAEESDVEFLARFSTYLQSLGNSLTTPNQISTFALSQIPSIGRIITADLTDSGANRLINANPVQGHISIFVFGIDSELTIFQKNEINNIIFSRMHAGLQLTVEDIIILEPTVSMAVTFNPAFEITSLENTIRNSLLEFLSPRFFDDTSGTIRRDAIISKVQAIPGVSFTSNFVMTCPDTTASGLDLVFNKKGCLPSLTNENIELTLALP